MKKEPGFKNEYQAIRRSGCRVSGNQNIRSKKMWLKGFLDFQRLRNESQIATIFTILIMVVFLLTIITINIGKIVQSRTQVVNAADAAALAMASSLGSLSRVYSHGEPSGLYCTDIIHWWQWIVIAIKAVITKGASLVVDLSRLGWQMYDIYDQMKGINRKMANLDLKQQIGEGAILTALSGVIADPNFIPDTHDYDEDTKQDDNILYFTKWYSKRLDALNKYSNNKIPPLKGFLENILKDFIYYVGGKRNCQLIDTNGDGVGDTMSCAYDAAVPGSKKGFSDGFLNDVFIPLCQDIENYHELVDSNVPDIDLDFWTPVLDDPPGDKVDWLIDEIDEFYLWAYIVLGYTFDSTNPPNYPTFFAHLDNLLAHPSTWLSHLYRVKWKQGGGTTEQKCFQSGIEHDDTDEDVCKGKCINDECAGLSGDELTACEEACKQGCRPDWYSRMEQWMDIVDWMVSRLQIVRATIVGVHEQECRDARDLCEDACDNQRFNVCEPGCADTRNNICYPACDSAKNTCDGNCDIVFNTCVATFCAGPGPHLICCAAGPVFCCTPAHNACHGICQINWNTCWGNCDIAYTTCMTGCETAWNNCYGPPGGCNGQFNTCMASLPPIIARIDNAISKLGIFKSKVAQIRPIIKITVTNYHTSSSVERTALYSWADKDANDNLIWHHVRVRRNDFVLPYPSDPFWRTYNWDVQQCVRAHKRYGQVCIKVEKYDSGVSHPLWNFVFHKGCGIPEPIISETDGEPLLTIDDIVKIDDTATNYLSQQPAYGTIYNEPGGLLASCGIKNTAYACFGWQIYEDAPAPAGWGGIRLVPEGDLGSCWK